MRSKDWRSVLTKLTSRAAPGRIYELMSLSHDILSCCDSSEPGIGGICDREK